jgi:hypothetical protein
MKKNTPAATKALESGIESTFVQRKNLGQICYEAMILTKNKKAIICMIDRSLKKKEQIYSAKIVALHGFSALRICLSYAA